MLRKNKISAARREIIETYKIVRQVPSRNTVVFRISKILGYKIDVNKNNTFVRRVLNEYLQELANK
jgi:hypothetical protein